MTSRDYFKGKRIALIGLGTQGEMMADATFLIKAGAWVSVYDLKSEARIKTQLMHLRSVGLANYVCGSIPSEDLLDMDLIILSHEYPRDSSFLKPVYMHRPDLPVEYPETLFFRLAPPLTLIGVMGACGRATVISILEPILKAVCEEHGGQQSFTLDPESEGGILTHLKRAKSGDIALMRILDPMLPELHTLRISPHVAIFTTIPTRSAYLSSPFEILDYQTYNNFIVASDEIIDAMRRMQIQPRGKMLRTKPAIVQADWGFQGKWLHDRANAALAVQVARLFKADDEVIRRALTAWKPLRGRLELVKKIKQVEFYNDAMSRAPDAILAGVTALKDNRNLVLICGGSDAGHEYRALFGELPRHVHTLVCVPGSGTLRQRVYLQELEGLVVHSAPSVEEAVRVAYEHAQKGDRVLFSPGFEAGGSEGSKMERGERFIRAVRGL